MYRILVINPGSTSTKSAIFEDKKCVADQSIMHTTEELKKNSLTGQQVDMRKSCILNWVQQCGFRLSDIDAFAVRGCKIKGCETGGTYLVNDALCRELFSRYDALAVSPHAARLSVPIALNLCEAEGIERPVYITDPPCLNELTDLAKVTGLPVLARDSVFHALNSKAVARRTAEELGKPYKQCGFIVAHMGGGISVAAHHKGHVIEVNDCTDGGGAFSPNRAGTLPVVPLIELCFSGQYTKSEMVQLVKNKGGVVAHLGTEDMREVEKRIDQGDKYAKLVFDALAYQVAKEIGACFVALRCEMDAIIFTGGMSNSKRLIDTIRSYVEKLGPIKVIPGEFESEALAFGALRVLNHEEEVILL